MCICLFLERKENPDGPRHFYRDAKATKPQRRRIQSYMKPEYFKALPRSPTAMLLYIEGLFTRGDVKGSMGPTFEGFSEVRDTGIEGPVTGLL